MNKVEIKSHGPTSAHHTISVDGHQVNASMARVEMDARSVPIITLTLPIIGDMSAEMVATVILDSHTRAALVALGWTPPSG